MSRMSWVLLGSVLAVAAVRGEPAVTIDSVQGLSATVSFTGLDAGTTNSLVLAWGGSDAAGETPADWPNRRDLGVVEPEDEQKVVDLPAGWGDSAQHVRFFLRTGVDAPANYAGTPVTWLDGVDNAGTGTHDPTATKWKDKAGTLDMRLTENGSWNTTHNGLDVNGSTARSAIPAELFTARISVVQLTGEDEDIANWTEEVPGTAKTLSDRAGEGAVDWYARPGVWRVSLDLMYEGGIFHTETAVYDMRRLRSESAIFIFY